MKKSAGLAAIQLTQEGMQGNSKMGVGMPVDTEGGTNLDSNSQLFTNLSLQALHEVFSRLQLATREFPHATQQTFGWAPGD